MLGRVSSLVVISKPMKRKARPLLLQIPAALHTEPAAMGTGYTPGVRLEMVRGYRTLFCTLEVIEAAPKMVAGLNLSEIPENRPLVVAVPAWDMVEPL